MFEKSLNLVGREGSNRNVCEYYEFSGGYEQF